MSTLLEIGGEKEPHDDDTTVEELKRMSDEFNANDTLGYDIHGQHGGALSDKDRVGDIPDGAQISTILDDKGAIFG